VIQEPQIRVRLGATAQEGVAARRLVALLHVQKVATWSRLSEESSGQEGLGARKMTTRPSFFGRWEGVEEQDLVQRESVHNNVVESEESEVCFLFYDRLTQIDLVACTFTVYPHGGVCGVRSPRF